MLNFKKSFLLVSILGNVLLGLLGPSSFFSSDENTEVTIIRDELKKQYLKTTNSMDLATNIEEKFPNENRNGDNEEKSTQFQKVYEAKPSTNETTIKKLWEFMNKSFWVVLIFLNYGSEIKWLINAGICWFLQIFFVWCCKKVYDYITNRVKPIPPRIFSEGMNAHKWICEFEEYLKLVNLKDNRSKCRELLKFLDPASGKLLRHACKCYDDDKFQDYETMKGQLLQLFVTTRISQRELRFKFYNRLQSPDESIHRYNHELSELATEAYPLCDKKIIDTLIYEQLLYGLHNQRIRNQLMCNYGTNIDLSEVIRVAKIQEECELMEKSRNRVTINNIGKVSRESSAEDKNRRVNSAKQTADIGKTVSFDTNEPRTNHNTSRKMVCWNCSREGHSSRNCDRKRHIYPPHRHTDRGRNGSYRNTNDTNTANGCDVNEGRPTQYTHKSFDRSVTPSSDRRNSSPVQTNLVCSLTPREKREIKGYCSLNGNPVPFIVDTGASRSVVSQRVLKASSGMKPFTSQATTADGAELKIEGVQDCVVKIGDSSCLTSVLVAPNLQQDFLIGMDVLNKCELTREHVDGLRNAVKKASDTLISTLRLKELEKLRLSEIDELPFQGIYNINEEDNWEQGFVLIPSKDEIVNEQMKEWIDEIQTAVKKIEAKGVHDLTITNVIKHSIEVIPGIEPIKQKRRPVPPHYMDAFRKSILEMEQAGLIEHAKSPWSSPIHIVRKEDNSIRITQDYKKLNNVTIKDAYPLPNIESMFCQLSKAKIFSKLDLTHGYWQIMMDEESRKYTAFACEMGFYQFKVLPMGLTNACATFQRMMDQVLNGLIGVICFVYLDDVIVFSDSDDKHVEHVKTVIERLKNANLKIKLGKCEFAVRKIEYLSHIIQGGMITPNPKKVAHVKNMEPPKTIRRLKGFLGYSSYYRKYIKSYSSIASPLTRNTIRTKYLKWNGDCQISFDNLKEILSSDLVLQLPNFDKPFRLDTDACNYGIGASLEQPSNDDINLWKPVAFYSKHLSETQQRYLTTERE